MGTFIGLLRGINVGGHRKVPMARLREILEAAGLQGVRTYVASGNLVFEADAAASAVERVIEEAICGEFGFDVDVLVRPASEWQALRATNPFPRESAEDPAKVMVTIGRGTPSQADAAALSARAGPNEKVALSGGALWIWFGDGAGRSKIAAGPARGVWTSRNWRTVEALAEMAGG